MTAPVTKPKAGPMEVAARRRPGNEDEESHQHHPCTQVNVLVDANTGILF